MNLLSTDNVNEDATRLTCHHTFSGGRKVTFKLFHGRYTLDWEPKPTERELLLLQPEYWEWWETILLRILQHYLQRPPSSCSLELNENNAPVKFSFSRSDGATVSVYSPSEKFFVVNAVRDGQDIPIGAAHAQALVGFVETFIYRSSSL